MNTLSVTATAIFALSSLWGGGDPVTVNRQVETMGTVLWMELEGEDRAGVLRASEEVLKAMEAAIARLSTWGTESELARFLAAPAGERVELTALLAQELSAAERLSRLTDGAFDPSIGALTRAWGLRRGGRTPSAEELVRAKAACGAELWDIDGRSAVRSAHGLLIDEGGFGKGAALDQALLRLAEDGVMSATLNLGGQLAFLGAETRVVPIADPRDRGDIVLEITVEGGSVATSANTERSGHLLDPRTGSPAKDFGSVTVWAESALAADALSTALFVLGPQDGLALAERMEGVEAVFIEQGKFGRKVSVTSGLSERSSTVGDYRTVSDDSARTSFAKDDS